MSFMRDYCVLESSAYGGEGREIAACMWTEAA
jgi:hypothetical protein